MSHVSYLPRFGRGATSSARMGLVPLTDEQVMQYAPSAFAQAAHESRSERYGYIPTSEIIHRMRGEGFVPVFAAQGRTRDPSRREHTKHMIRFRHMGGEARQVGDTFPEAVLVNSHDGTSSYHIHAGLLRFICLNGMVTSDGPQRTVKVPHKGDVVRQVIEGSYEVLGESIRTLNSSREWGGIALSQDMRDAFAEAALQIRFADDEGNVSTPVQPRQLLEPVRREDVGNDLWRTFSVVQERTVRGGIHARGQDANGRRRNVTTRAIEGIDGSVKLNQALWMLGERMAEILGNHRAAA